MFGGLGCHVLEWEMPLTLEGNFLWAKLGLQDVSLGVLNYGP